MLAIVLIPSAALLVIGVGAAGYLVYDGYQARDWATTMQATATPGTQFVAEVEEERRLSLLQLGGDPTAAAPLAEQRKKLDTRLAGLQSMSANLAKLNPDALQEGNAAFQKVLGQLQTIRQGVDSGQVPLLDVYGYYSGLTEIIKLGVQGLAKTAPDTTTAVEESTSALLLGAADAMSRAHALAVAGVTKGGLTPEEYVEFSRQVGRYHTELESAAPTLVKEQQERFGALAATSEWTRLSEMESALILRGPRPSPVDPDTRPLPMSLPDWQNAATTVNKQLLNIYNEHHHYAEGFAAETGKRTFVNSLIGGGVILLITLLAALAATWLSNRMVRRLKRLRADTLQLADVQLPDLVYRLRRGEQIDVETEVPPLDYGPDEIGQVADAFNKAQRTAVGAAAHEAETKNGVRAVFLNIAHRSQVVVRRQLEVLDNAERKQEDPEQLETLFHLDHLATRQRRNAENLLILGGEQPGRQWRNPVPLVEIVRSAVSETENYRRVHTTRLPAISMTGSVVADLIHLLAELVDNATSFSPPDSRVEVRGNMVGKGVVIEVEDQGLGIEREEREEVNAFLHDPPDFGVMALSEDARLGLFVVSQLAARHGISVTLVESVYGGIRAIVLIRSALIADETTPPAGQQNGVPAETAAETTADLPRPRREQLPDMPTPESYPPVREPLRHSETMPRVEAEPAEPTPNGNGTEPLSADTRPPLPRRRRQASLSPRLVAETETAAPPDQGAMDADGAAAAEWARNRMAAFQRGTRDGRAAQ
jgi:signal transduction histidine kinase